MSKIAIAKLKKSDPVLAKIIQRLGLSVLKGRPKKGSHFEALAEAIIYQQLNGKAAGTILGRFKEIYAPKHFPSPEDVKKTPNSKLRKAGLSGQKLSYIKDLAHKVVAKTICLEDLPTMADEDVVTALTEVKGIGRWTAEMFLMFRLNRPDILPVGDYGFRKAVQQAYKLRELPEAKVLHKLSEPWRPYRSIATRYLWRSLDAD